MEEYAVMLTTMPMKESGTRRSLAIGLLSLTASCLGSMAPAQDLCGCNRVLPNSGSYDVLFPEKVGRPGAGTAEVEVTNVGDVLGALIIARSGPGVLSMSCQPDGSFTGDMQPMNQPSRIPALVGLVGLLDMEPEDIAGVDGQVPLGLSIAGEFEVIVNRPGMAAAANEVMVPTLSFVRQGGAGEVPPEFCARIKHLTDESEKRLAAYGNDDLVQIAFENKLAGLNEHLPNNRAWPNYGTERSYRIEDLEVTYEELVQLYALGIDLGSGSLPPIDYADLHAKAVAANEQDPEGVERAASTSPETCLITPPSERDSNGNCRLTIEIAAMMAHEQIHRARCLEAKRVSGDESAYLYWGNHPPNHAYDEREAYAETLATLTGWYEAHCGG